MRSRYCLVVEKEGKNNKSMVKHCWLYQSNCQVLRYCSHRVLIHKKRWTKHIKVICIVSIHAHACVFLISADRRRGTDRWTAITDTEQ